MLWKEKNNLSLSRKDSQLKNKRANVFVIEINLQRTDNGLSSLSTCEKNKKIAQNVGDLKKKYIISNCT